MSKYMNNQLENKTIHVHFAGPWYYLHRMNFNGLNHSFRSKKNSQCL